MGLAHQVVNRAIVQQPGAHLGITDIHQFQDAFDNVTQVILDQNYRSTQTILDAANAVIANNPGRAEKHLWSDKGFWKSPAVSRLYGWRPTLRMVAAAMVLAVAVVAVIVVAVARASAVSP